NRMKGYITVRRRGKPGVARCGPGARSSMNRDRRISHEATKARSYQMFLRVFVSSWRPAAVLIQRGRSTSLDAYGLAEPLGVVLKDKTTTVGAPGLRSTQKFDGLPDATATYCLPPTAYVTTPPPIGPPVLKRYNTVPFFASNTVKSPVSSPVITTSPAVVVTAATIGRGERYFHFTAPVAASIAVSQPCAFSGGSRSVRPPI